MKTEGVTAALDFINVDVSKLILRKLRNVIIKIWTKSHVTYFFEVSLGSE